MAKQKKSFLDKIVGTKEKDLEESVNLEQDLGQSEKAADEQNNKRELEQELDDVSKEQIKKDILKSEKKEGAEKPASENPPNPLLQNGNFQEESKKTTSEKWLDDSESSPNKNGEEGQLAIDVYQTAEEIVIKSIVGGVKSKELDISINNDMVVIKGIRQNPDEVASEDYYYQECFWGNFSRSVILPTEVDAENVRAAIKNGILTVKLPKLKKTTSKKIEVETI